MKCLVANDTMMQGRDGRVPDLRFRIAGSTTVALPFQVGKRCLQ